MWIDQTVIRNNVCLTFTDNGNGMNADKLHKMLSFGFSDKVTVNGHVPVGLYGNGFKSGSMRLGKDSIVFTKNGETMNVGLLSQSYLEAISAEHVVVPIVTYTYQRKIICTPESQASLKALLKYSLFSTEKDLLAELDAILGKKGTRIIIWNIRKTKDGKFEFDFSTDKYDIRIPDDAFDEKNGKKGYTRLERLGYTVPESDYSLRAYCSILYLKPRMQIVLRGQKVKAQFISKSLAHIECDVYKPTFYNKNIRITFGFNWKNKEHYGIMLYHKNRLIKAYEKVGCQLKANNMGVGVIGVIECNFLKPTHNKQDFDYTKEYRLTMAALGQKLNDYWNEMKVKRNQEDPQNLIPVEDVQKRPDQNWVQCDACLKWRKLPDGIIPEKLPEKWFCYMNPDPQFRSCNVAEEPEDVDDVFPTYEKTYKKLEQKDREKKMKAMEQERKQMDTSENAELQRFISEITQEAKTIRKERDVLRKKLKEQTLQVTASSPPSGTSSPNKAVTRWLVNENEPLRVANDTSTLDLSALESDNTLVITDVRSLSSANTVAGCSTKRKTANDFSPFTSKRKKLSNKPNSTEDDDIIILEEHSTPKPKEKVDLLKVKIERRNSTEQTGMRIECDDDVQVCNETTAVNNCQQGVCTQTEGNALPLKQEGNAVEDVSLDTNSSKIDSCKVEKSQETCSVRVHQKTSINRAVEAAVEAATLSVSVNKVSSTDNGKELNDLKNLLTLTAQERQQYANKCESLTSQVKKMEQEVVELKQKSLKKEVCHRSTETEIPSFSDRPAVADFCKLHPEEMTVLYEQTLKEIDRLKEQIKSVNKLKCDCASKDRKDIKNELDDLALQLDSVFRELDRCTNERDQYKEQIQELRQEKNKITSQYEQLVKETEQLKSALQKSKDSAASSGTQVGTNSDVSDVKSVKLKSVRLNIGKLLSALLPDLDLQHVSYDTDGIDEILEQVLDQINNK
ncbi:MORC family CW-type zinc finger protein 3 [Protopterus annectens]|uniref:MORC family CW-type zinc finger protein 3 n=1 Tax=Protopterus annectens TaxID=7888 RepID=UPI001CF9D963|nr:MORC family CW-type zinc finger protein 3 [Protopterus annectens]